MISEINQRKTANLVQLAETRGISVRNEEDSHVAVMNENSRPASELLIQGKTALESMVMTTAEGTMIGDDHEVSLQNYAEILGNGIRDQAALAKDVALPFINHVVDSTVAKVAEAAIRPYSIEQVYLADIHDNPAIYEMLTEYKEVLFMETYRPYGFPELTEEEILSNMQIGSSSMDRQLADMVAKHDEGWVSEVYNKHFAGNVTGKYLPLIGIEVMDELLVAHLICVNLLNSELDMSELYPMHDTETVLLNYRNVTGVALLRIHKAWDQVKITKQLVMAYPISSWFPVDECPAVIKVFGDTYEDFIHAGGTPELLIGSAVGTRNYDSTAILESAETLRARYNTYIGACNEEISKRMGTIIRSGAARAIEEHINEVDSSKLAPHGEVRELIELFMGKVAEFRDFELKEEPYRCLRIAICNSLFSDTSVLEFLVRIDTYMEANENMTAREAAYYASADMIVEHLTSQVSVSEVPVEE